MYLVTESTTKRFAIDMLAFVSGTDDRAAVKL